MRNQIRCLVPKNNAVVIVINDDRHAKTCLRTLITSKVICIRICLPLFVVTCPVTTFCPQCSASLFAATASTFEELTKLNCGANQGGQTFP